MIAVIVHSLQGLVVVGGLILLGLWRSYRSWRFRTGRW
jgi:hypothetical protein